MGIVHATVLAAGAAALLWACGAPPAPRGSMAASPASRVGQPRQGLDGCGLAGTREAVLRQVNAARTAGAVCGAQRRPTAPPLAWSPVLHSVAERHSADMARRDYFDHATPEGARVGARALAEGYRWRAVGENIAGGDRTAGTVMSGWMASEGHCRNIMNPEYSEIGVACVARPGTTWGTYWTMVLGRPR